MGGPEPRRRCRSALRRAAAGGLVVAALLLAGIVPAAPAAASATPRPAPASTITAGPFRFALPVHITVPGSATSLATAQLVPGGPVDLVTGNRDGTVSAILNRGDGSFAKPVSYQTGVSAAVVGIAVGDFTGDGVTDVVAAMGTTGAHAIVVLPGAGDGTFRPPVDTSTGTDQPTAIAAGQLLGSGRLDIAVGMNPVGSGLNGHADVVIFPGLGGGRFGAAVGRYPVAGDYGAAGFLATAVLTGSGRTDFVASDEGCGYDGGGVTVWANRGGGKFARTFAGLECPSTVAIGQFDHSGHAGLFTTTGVVLAGRSGGVLLSGRGDGSFTTATTPGPFPPADTPGVVAAADMNADGSLDLVAAGTTAVGNVLLVAAGRGNGTFAPAVAAPVGGGAVLDVETAALTPGGLPDVITLGNDGNLTVLLNRLPPPAVTNPAVSVIATSLPTPAQAFPSVLSTSVGAAVTLGAFLFLTFPSQLFNAVLDENREELANLLRRFARQRRPHGDTATGRRRELAAFAAVLAGGSVLGSALDPRFGLNTTTGAAIVALALAFLVALVIPALVAFGYHRSQAASTLWRLHAVPAGLAVAVLCVVVSRVTAFEPGYLYGVIAAVIFARPLTRPAAGHVVALSSAAVLLVSVGAWLLWVPVNSAATHPGAFFGLVVLDDFLAGVFVSGLVGGVVTLLPLRFLPGDALRRWSAPAWLAAFTLSLFGVIQVLLHTHSPSTIRGAAPMLTTCGLFVVFAALSVAAFQYSEARRRRARGESVPAVGDRVRAMWRVARRRDEPQPAAGQG